MLVKLPWQELHWQRLLKQRLEQQLKLQLPPYGTQYQPSTWRQQQRPQRQLYLIQPWQKQLLRRLWQQQRRLELQPQRPWRQPRSWQV